VGSVRESDVRLFASVDGGTYEEDGLRGKEVETAMRRGCGEG